MYSVLLFEKAGTLAEKKVKSFDKLYGLCNYRSEDGFELLQEWKKSNHVYKLYGKRKGKQNGENKCVLPSPLQDSVFYGTLCLIKKVDEEESSITLTDWNLFLESLQKEETSSDEKELKKEEYEQE